jgi:hypothetical protein
MDAGVLAVGGSTEIHCPVCGKIHVWDSGKNRLVAKPRSSKNST